MRKRMEELINTETEERRNNRMQQNANAMRVPRRRVGNHVNLVNNHTYNEENIQVHNCGDLNALCQFCRAKHFASE
ncbi:Hypothetical predicted protein [Octopus vulgaris]|uniref:Uncharacterized protein n=1 Tax=Octopus vulgaris TaxID=6645 RepID=A0AA36APJ7_OCTVU|nr:Hypothetical predicted protein [Octopus vulgaris]